MIRLLQPGEEEGCGVSIWNRHTRDFIRGIRAQKRLFASSCNTRVFRHGIRAKRETYDMKADRNVKKCLTFAEQN